MVMGSLSRSILFGLAEYLVVLVPAALVGLWLTGRRETSFFVFVTVVVSLVVSYAMSLIYSHPAPYMVSQTLVSGPPENSFPSQHTTVMFAMVWPLLYRKRRRLAGVFFIGAVLTGIARVSVGFHYPIDILGAVVASIIGTVLVVIAHEYVATVGQWAIELDNRIRERFIH
jgi:undecaprenyl-diphosphatase